MTTPTKMKISKAVLISDIHFNLSPLKLASKSLELAIDKSNELEVPLVIAGDLNDTKDIIRGKVANKLIKLIQQANIKPYILIGNHDLLNEKSDEHGLNFLKPYAEVVDSTRSYLEHGLNFVPYQNSSEEFLKQINRHEGVVICHQGFLGAQMGDYVQDKTAVSPEEVKDLIIISGHYHKHQTIGTVTYIGSPYTITYGEANDGPKGFQILFDDGSLQQVPTNLRKHVITERNFDNVLDPIPNLNPEDLLWLKVSGPDSELDKLDKKHIGFTHLGHSNFKLDKIYNVYAKPEIDVEIQSESDVFDKIIDFTDEPEAQRIYLKSLWREVV